MTHRASSDSGSWDELDLGDLTTTARRQVQFLLRDEQVDIDEDRDVIRFPSSLRFVVTGAIEDATTPDAIRRRTQHRRDHTTPVTDPEIASPVRRVVAGVLDYVIVGAVASVMSLLLRQQDVPESGWIAFIVAQWCVVVIPIALTGRPPGARVARTHVINASNINNIGVATSALRWFVAHLPLLAVGGLIELDAAAGLTVAALQIGATLAIYASLFFNPLRQGLHDRAARTVVVTHQSLTEARRPTRQP